MKRFIIYPFFFLILVALFSIIFFNRIKKFAQNRIENYISKILPEGSKYKNMSIDFFESCVEEITIPDFGSAKRIVLRYTPLEIIFRRIRNISIEDADIIIKEKSNEKAKRFFPVLVVNDIRFKNINLHFKKNNFYLNSSISLISSKKRILLRIKKISVSSDFLSIDNAYGDISISDNIFLNLYSVRTGESNYSLKGNIDSLNLNGDFFIQDFLKQSPFKGHLSLNITFNKKNINGDGKIKKIEYNGNKIENIIFKIKENKISLKGKGFEGEISNIFKEKKDIKINFKNFELSEVNKIFRKTRFSGDANISLKKDTLSFSSFLRGIFYGISSETLIVNGSYSHNFISIDKIYSSNGEISGNLRFSLKDTILNGYINGYGLTISEIPYLRRFLNEGKLTFQFTFNGSATGSIWAEDCKGKYFGLKSIGMNIDIEDLKKMKGSFDIFLKDCVIRDRKIEDIYFTGFFRGFNIDAKGLIKSEYLSLRTNLEKDGNIVNIKKINIITQNDTIFSISPTRIILERDKVNITGFSLSNGGDFKTGLNLNLRYNGEIEGGISLLNLNLKDIRNIIKKEVNGFVDLIITFSGRSNEPYITLNMKGRNIGEEYTFGDSVSVFLTGTRKIAKVFMKIFENGANSEVSGEYSFSDKNFKGRVELNSASDWVFIFFKKFVKAENSNITGSLDFSGKGSIPEINGDVSIKNVDLTERNSGIKVNGLKGVIKCEGDSVKFEEFKGNIGDGELKFKGFFIVKDKKYSLDFIINNGYISYDYYSALFDCSMNISDDVKGVKLTGKASIKEATVTLPFYFKEGGKRLEKLYINMFVSANEGNVWLKNENADIEFKGEGNIFYDWGIPSAIGEFEVIKGSFKYFLTEFKIEEGRFTFSKRGEIDPEIKLTSSQIRDKDTIFLNVSGSMKKPEFSIYSKPPKELSEILLILGLNMSWQELVDFSSSQDNLRNTAFKAFDFWARNRLENEFSKILGMDFTRIERSLSYKLTLGKYIKKDLYLQLGTEFYPTAKIEYIMEYRFSKWGTIKYQDNMDTRNAMIKFTIRY
uniref:Translocation and assembly module TamB C-terminal domain-containing protein n=1 Tax=candidate division WOR-3 bacterium TaxID=2052148 RepID=A0A7C4YHT0_UNCW3